MTTNSINFRFFRISAQAYDDATIVNGVRKLHRGTGHVCVAAKKAGNSFRVSFAFKSPVDNLDTEFGRKIASGRLASKKPNRNFVVKASNIDDAVSRALTSLFKKTRIVQRRGEEVERSIAPDWLLGAVANKKPLIETKAYRIDAVEV